MKGDKCMIYIEISETEEVENISWWSGEGLWGLTDGMGVGSEGNSKECNGAKEALTKSGIIGVSYCGAGLTHNMVREIGDDRNRWINKND